MADCDGVDAFVNAPDAFFSVDVHEGCECAWGFDAGGGDLVFGYLDRFHACAEAHGSVGLSDPSSHPSSDTGGEVMGAEGAGVVFCF